jgi:hypothetical protein
MIAHVVLFRPQAGLTDAERATFIGALEHALVNIPLIKRARVGRRITLGRHYDDQNANQFPYAAIIEFDTEDHLREYLDHPAHKTLGDQFYYAAEAALVFDFELLDGDRAKELL